MAVERQAVLKLYKAILRESEKLSAYNFRMYAIRRAKDAFRENRSLSSSSEIDSAFSEGKSSLESLQRQVLVSNLYSADKLVMAWTGVITGGTPRVNHAGVLIGDLYYVFGGYARAFEPPVSIVGHTFNLRTHQWSKLSYADGSHSPSMRFGHTVVYYKGCIYLWGGRNDEQVCNELFRFDPKLSMWHLEKTEGTRPPPRDGHTACMIGSRMYIFGGFDAYPIDQFGIGLYAVDLETHEWKRIRNVGLEPSCRDFHGAVAVGSKMYIFGGRSTLNPPHHDVRCIAYPNSMYIYDAEKEAWLGAIQVDGEAPVGRRSHCLFVHYSNIYLFGGYNCRTKLHLNDFWKFNMNNWKWSKIQTLGNAPSPRRRMTCFLYNDYVYFYGGTEPRLGSVETSDEDEDGLVELGDIHVLELEPTLVTLCMMTVKKFNINYDGIPVILASALRNSNMA